MYTRIAVIIVLIIFCNATIGASVELNNIDFKTENNTINSNKTDIIVDIQNGLLDLMAKDVSIKNVIEDIAKIIGAKCWLFDGAQEKITMEFRSIPLQEGIARILKNKNYVFLYNQDENDAVLCLVRSRQIPRFGSRDKVHHNSFDAARLETANSIGKILGNNTYRRKHKSNETEQNSFESGKISSNENKQKIQDRLAGIDISGITNSLSQSIDTSLQGVSSSGTVKVIEALNTSAGRSTQNNTSGGGATELQFIENLNSSINLDKLKKLLHVASSQ